MAFSLLVHPQFFIQIFTSPRPSPIRGFAGRPKEELSLAHCELKDLSHVCEMLETPELALTSLDLSANSFGDDEGGGLGVAMCMPDGTMSAMDGQMPWTNDIKWLDTCRNLWTKCEKSIAMCGNRTWTRWQLLEANTRNGQKTIGNARWNETGGNDKVQIWHNWTDWHHNLVLKN